MKIAYIGIDLFLPALSYLVENGCELVELFTCETDDLTEFHSGVVALAQRLNAPYTTHRIQVLDFDRLLQKGCQAVICAGYYYKIPVYPAIPTINIHPSLLPYGRGGWPMPWDILMRRPVSGVTLHKIDSGFDTGDILLQRHFTLDERETLESFMLKVYALLPEMLGCLLADFEGLYHAARPQSEGVYLPMPEKEQYSFSAQTPLETVDLLLRAFYGYDCYYRTQDGEYRLIRAYATTAKPKMPGVRAFPVLGGYAVCDEENIVKL